METRINPTGIIFTAAFGAFLATFNETFMNVALVPIMADLSVDAGTEGGHVVGTISRSDLMRHLFNESARAEA